MSSIQTSPYRILQHFSECTDPRTRPVSYPLLEIIVIVFLSTLCGEEGWESMLEWGEDKLPFLRNLLPYNHGIPSADTLRRVIERIDPEEFLTAFTSWATEFQERTSEQICIDGKSLKSSNRKQSPLHIVSAWSEKNRLVLGDVSTDAKSNEIPAIYNLLTSLTLLKGDIVTIDAIGCQKKITQEIRRQKADYVIALKKNQFNLSAEVENFFDQAIEAESYAPCIATKMNNVSHGREEEHAIWVSTNLDWLPQLQDWSDLATVIMVQRRWNVQGKEKEERRYYISSLKSTAEHFHELIRRHWSIENHLHWHLDVTFNEDASRIRNSANKNLRIARLVSLEMLRSEKNSGFKKSLKARSRRCLRSNSYLQTVLEQGKF